MNQAVADVVTVREAVLTLARSTYRLWGTRRAIDPVGFQVSPGTYASRVKPLWGAQQQARGALYRLIPGTGRLASRQRQQLNELATQLAEATLKDKARTPDVGRMDKYIATLLGVPVPPAVKPLWTKGCCLCEGSAATTDPEAEVLCVACEAWAHAPVVALVA